MLHRLAAADTFIDDPAKHSEQIGHAVDLVGHHQPVPHRTEVAAHVGQRGQVAGVFQIEVESGFGAARRAPTAVAGPAHGYQVAMSVEERTGGIFSLQHGTLYPILHRLEADGQLRGEWSGDGRRRKTYRITAAGQTTLREGAADLLPQRH